VRLPSSVGETFDRITPRSAGQAWIGRINNIQSSIIIRCPSRNEIVFARSRKAKILTKGIHWSISRINPAVGGIESDVPPMAGRKIAIYGSTLIRIIYGL